MTSRPPQFTYQAYAHHKVATRRKTAVIAPPGSGKTRPIITGIDALGGWECALVTCSGPAIATWKRQIPEWSDHKDVTIVSGSAIERRALWVLAAKQGGIFICNFAVFYRDYEWIRQVPWLTVIADEYHKVMRSHKIHVKSRAGQPPRLKTYGKFKQLTRHVPNMVLATGSLMRRDASSMFTAFQLCDQKLFSSYWRFVKTFCHFDDTGFGRRIFGVRNAQKLRELMDVFFAYIPPEVVADQLPNGRRYGIDVEITPEQKRLYKQLEEDMMVVVEHDGGLNVIMTPTILARMTKQRQLLCCPRILDPNFGMGAGYEAIVDRLDMDDHVAIFVPFRPAVDLIVEDLIMKGYKAWGLYGGTSPEDQKLIIDTVKTHKGILVCTIAYAESFDLETIKNSYFLGYDLSVDQNEQAEGRTRRAISKHEYVSWGYIKTDTMIDEHFLNKLGEDASNVRLVLQRPEGYIRKLLQIAPG